MCKNKFLSITIARFASFDVKIGSKFLSKDGIEVDNHLALGSRGVYLNCRCVVVCGVGKGFSAGLDVKDPRLMDINSDAGDPARRALRAQRQVRFHTKSYLLSVYESATAINLQA